ncbi:MAG: PAS domain-containing protein [Verrucomicrobia bacterium]|nr:PAS domain-containing protein [Verrucomicrobiota bacterium]
MKSAFIEKLIGKMDRLDPQSVASIVSMLVREKGFLETVFNALDEGILVLGDDQKALYFNRAAREMLGLNAQFAAGDSLKRHLPEPFWSAIEDDRACMKPRAAVHHDVEISYPQRRFLQIYVNTLPADVSPESDLLLIIRDVTEAHRRAVLNAESERIGAVTTLAAGVAHEIGNPLNSLHIYMQLIEREVRHLDPATRKKMEGHLRVCTDEIARLDQIVNQFLKAVRPTRPVLEPHAMNEILMEVIEVLKPEISNRDVLVEKELGRDLPHVWIDRDQMKQVFFNIIRNSLQAMTRGGILHVRTELQADRIVTAIRDTGGGIPPESLQRIFEPYFTTKADGSGLGLMIVERVVREHGGLIEVSSEQGRGTTFRILLPTAEKRVRLLEDESSLHDRREVPA